HGEVGLCIPSKNGDGETIYLLGVIVDDFKRATDDMMTIDIPEATLQLLVLV
ncbi:MAG TPA: AraC family transcriptional regulator, partial [Terrisporobacter glycolicus]|nr:AraC family transcriptional regulator [Terrisporobacter hibernicus]